MQTIGLLLERIRLGNSALVPCKIRNRFFGQIPESCCDAAHLTNFTLPGEETTLKFCDPEMAVYTGCGEQFKVYSERSFYPPAG